MPEIHYCWRCKCEAPFLTEEEWQEIEPLLHSSIQEIKRIRMETGASLGETLKNAELPALKKFNELTGFGETNVNAIWHHRRSSFGPECARCGHLLRTPKATFCAECGYSL